MFKFRNEKKQDFLQGRKINYVARILEVSGVHLGNVLNGKSTCSSRLAYRMMIFIGKNYNYEEINEYFISKKVD